MYLRAVIKPRHCGPLHGDRKSVEARKPQRKGYIPPGFAPGLCPAFSNVRTRPASGWSDDQPRWVNWPRALPGATCIISGSRRSTGQTTPNFFSCLVQLCDQCCRRRPCGSAARPARRNSDNARPSCWRGWGSSGCHDHRREDIPRRVRRRRTSFLTWSSYAAARW